MIYRIFLIALISLIFCEQATAQKEVETQSLLWTRYQLKADLSEKYRVRQEVERRTYWSTWQQHQLVARTFLERRLGKGWNTGVGFTYFRQTLPHKPDAEAYTIRTELRPQLELAYRHSLSDKVSIHHRYWSEFRIFEQPEGGFEYGNNRSRYKVELQYKLRPNVSLAAFEEIHLNIGRNIVNNVFDQNRYGGSMRYDPVPALGLEFGYINWFQQRASGFEFYNRHIVRFTLHHTINFKTPAAN